MLDINQVIGIVYYSKNAIAYNSIKQALSKIVVNFDEDDVGIIMGEYAKGPGEAIGALRNIAKQPNLNEFINLVKLTIRTISDADLDCPKNIFIVSDEFPKELSFSVYKMKILNELNPFPTKIHSLQLHPTDKCFEEKFQRTIVSNEEHLFEEMANILKEGALC